MVDAQPPLYDILNTNRQPGAFSKIFSPFFLMQKQEMRELQMRDQQYEEQQWLDKQHAMQQLWQYYNRRRWQEIQKLGNKYRYYCACGYGSNNRSNMSRHKRTHTRIKPYKCMHCGCGFVSSTNRRRHEKTCIKIISAIKLYI